MRRRTSTCEALIIVGLFIASTCLGGGTSFKPLSATETGAESLALAVYRNGRVVVGWSEGESFDVWKWTEHGGMSALDLPSSPEGELAIPYALSEDGSVIWAQLGSEFFRWSSPSDFERIAPPELEPFRVVATSADGSIRAGTIRTADTYHAFRESPSGGIQIIGGDETRAYAISPDGSTVIGMNDAMRRNPDPDGGEFRGEPFYWNDGTGYQGFGFVPGYTRGQLRGVSADARVAVGSYSREPLHDGYVASVAFRWTLADGLQSLGFARERDGVSFATHVTDDGARTYGTSSRCGRFVADPYVMTSGTRTPLCSCGIRRRACACFRTSSPKTTASTPN
jgi:uncharacterized membrane protein